MGTLLQLTFSGLTVGAIYALVAIGFTLIYRSTDIFNFAQGEFFMLGGMVTATGYSMGMPLAVAAGLAIAVTVACGLALHLFAIQPAKGAGSVQLLIITIGASVLIRGVTSVTLGKDFAGFPNFVSPDVIRVDGAVIQTQALIVLTGTAVMVAGLWMFLTRSVLGKAVTATAANRIAARLVGINPSLIVALCFGISALIGAVGGILGTPITLTSYDAGTLLAVKGFAAAMLGGLGNPFGPIVGGLFIGLLEAFGAGYVSSAYKDAFAFIVLLGVISFRPQGIFSGQAVERV